MQYELELFLVVLYIWSIDDSLTKLGYRKQKLQPTIFTKPLLVLLAAYFVIKKYSLYDSWSHWGYDMGGIDFISYFSLSKISVLMIVIVMAACFISVIYAKYKAKS